MKIRTLQVLLIVAISFFAGEFIGSTKIALEWKNYHPQINFVNKEPPATMPTVDMSLFYNTWQQVYDKYYDKNALDSKKMLYGAIGGLVQSVGDPYTMFLPPVQNSSFQSQLAGQFQGIGAELSQNDTKQIIVIAPLQGSPAEKAGLQAGDTVLKVDSTSIATWTLPQVVNKIRGPKGSTVTLTVQHKGQSKTVDILIVRDVITVKSVDGWVKQVKDIPAISTALKSSSNGQQAIGYVDLSQFGDGTNKDWAALIDRLSPQLRDRHAKGLILDLRNNPGGYLTDATFVAGEFLPQDTTVVIQDEGNDNTQKLTVNRVGKLLDIPLVVLINRGSASASEIVSGALRDHNRAKLVGETSYGKGTVQEAVDLGGGAGVHVTIAKWLTPNGTWVSGKGLTPDISVTLDPKDPSHDTQLEKAIEVLLGTAK